MKKILSILVVLFAVALFAADKPNPRVVLVPTVGIGKLSFGMLRPEVDQIMGKRIPGSDSDKKMYYESCPDVGFQFDIPDITVDKPVFRFVGAYVRTPNVVTDKGIGVGSNLQQVEKAYGRKPTLNQMGKLCELDGYLVDHTTSPGFKLDPEKKPVSATLCYTYTDLSLGLQLSLNNEKRVIWWHGTILCEIPGLQKGFAFIDCHCCKSKLLIRAISEDSKEYEVVGYTKENDGKR